MLQLRLLINHLSFQRGHLTQIAMYLIIHSVFVVLTILGQVPGPRKVWVFEICNFLRSLIPQGCNSTLWLAECTLSSHVRCHILFYWLPMVERETSIYLTI